MHAFVFSFWLWAYKKKKIPQFLIGIRDQQFDTCHSVRNMHKVMNTTKPPKDRIESTKEATMTDTAQLSRSCWQMGGVTFAKRSRSACHAKWMGIQLAEPKSIRPARRGSSLLTTVWCKRLEMMLLKRWIKQNWTGNKWNKEGETNKQTKKN